MRSRKILSRGTNPTDGNPSRRRRAQNSGTWLEFLQSRPDLLAALCDGDRSHSNANHAGNTRHSFLSAETPPSQVITQHSGHQDGENTARRWHVDVANIARPDGHQEMHRNLDFSQSGTLKRSSATDPTHDTADNVDTPFMVEFPEWQTSDISDQTPEYQLPNNEVLLEKCESLVPGTELECLKKRLTNLRKVISPWTNILGLVTVCGSVRYTVKQYNLLRDLLKWNSTGCQLPSYSAIQRTIFPHVLEWCLPRSSIEHFEIDMAKVKSTPLNFQEIGENTEELNRERTAPVRVVLPSEWAKLDVLMYPLYDSMFCQGHMKDSIENSEIVRDRASVLNAGEFIFATFRGRPVKVFPGAKVLVDINFVRPRTSLLDYSKINTVVREYEVTGFTNRGCTLSGTVSSVWCVGSEDRISSSSRLAQSRAHGSTRYLIRKLSRASALKKTGMENTSRVRNQEIQLARNDRFRKRKRTRREITVPSDRDNLIPGDIVCLLLPGQSQVQRELFVLVVYRYWKHDGVKSVRLLFVKTSHLRGSGEEDCEENCDRNNVSLSLGHDDLLASHEVVGHVRLDCNDDDDLDMASGARSRIVPKSDCKGILQDGTPYVVYRVLLYCDDFQPLSPTCQKGSAGGFYMLPLGLLPRDRSTRAATRLIGLTPPGVSTNQLMLHIIPDLMRACVDGIQGRSPDGEDVRIFIDVVGFLGDYLESAHGVDLLGHRANSPCTTCSVRKNRDSDRSSLGYTTILHGSNSSVLRTAERHWALRESGIDDNDCNLLGMYSTARVSNESCPLLKLHSELQKVRSDIQKANHGGPVVSGLFDPYRSNVIAPDHLLSGLAKDIMQTAFAVLPGKEWKQRMDYMVCSALSENGLIRQRSTYHVSKGTLHGMSLSSTFCMLLCCVPVYRNIINALNLGDEVQGRVLEALECLNRLISLTYWWPEQGVDHPNDVACFDLTKSNNKYICSIQDLAVSYLEQVDALSVELEIARKQLDKPNLHRLLELYFHSLPAFGHAKHFTELVLENAHQPLKRCITKSNHHNAQISAVAHCLGNDWQGRISLLHQGVKKSNSDDEEKYKRGLRRLLIGSQMTEMVESNEEHHKFGKQADELVSTVLVEPLLHILQGEGNAFRLHSNEVTWKTSGNMKGGGMKAIQIGTNSTIDVQELLSRGENLLRKYYLDYGYGEEWAAHLRKNARRVRNMKFGNGSQQSASHELIYTGCVVETLISPECIQRPDRLLFPQGNGMVTVERFAVVGIIEREEEESPWAVVIRCDISNGFLRMRPNMSTPDFQLLYLTNAVRRISIFHACGHDGVFRCQIDQVSKRVGHKGNIFSGELFHWLDRKAGYPPRMA